MISLLVINYRSAPLAIDAIRSARAATDGELQVVVVDNSVDASEADRLRGHSDVLLTPDRNLGYAGAINAGRARCRGEVIVVANADVVFSPASIDKLAGELDRAAVAGPALFWDDAMKWMLPPSELHTSREKLGEAIASRSAWLARRRDRRRIAARLHFWSATWTVETRAISGAVMAIRAADFDAIGGFDERFPLYFEENDFLRRMTKRGKRIAYVPSARCRHIFNQSAGSESERAAAAYADSEMRYLEKWHGRTLARLAKAIERPRPSPDPQRVNGPLDVPPRALVEASPLPSFETAAGHFPTSAAVDIPPEVWSAYRSPVLYLRVIDPPTRRVLATYARYKS
ncbi:MAG TPA: glycosyltransferase [Thermoanaerobaculia bacterium]